MLIQRLLLPQLQKATQSGRVVILYGPRQTGKTTLVRELVAQAGQVCRYINADELLYRDALGSQDKRALGDLIGDARLFVVDEAQRVPEIGLNLKIIVDSFPDVAVVATGSASFDLANKVNEPLTGRTLTFTLYPISYAELSSTYGAFEARADLERWLLWGSYPGIVTADATLRERLLGELVGSYLYRDILELDGIRRSNKIVDLLRLLAFQIGQEVSVQELGTILGISRQTVERYLDLLEKVFVIFRVGGLARNLRKEISKTVRYYFYDNGVRNSLIQNFNRLSLRNDVGQLWENYLMVERRKVNEYAGRQSNIYFWRTYDQKELDYVEERGGILRGYEFKWQGGVRAAVRREFETAYPGAEIETITPENFTDFVS